MTEEPFFHPTPPEPELPERGQPVYPDLPGRRPQHIPLVTVPLGIELARTTDTLVLLEHAQVCTRGALLAVSTFLRPTTERSEPYADYVRGAHVQMGVVLADGTCLGRGGPEDEDWLPTAERGLAHSDYGTSEPLVATSARWLWPLPDGESFDVVVACPERDIRETRTTVPLPGLRKAADATTELWPWPPMPEGSGAGWFVQR